MRRVIPMTWAAACVLTAAVGCSDATTGDDGAVALTGGAATGTGGTGTGGSGGTGTGGTGTGGSGGTASAGTGGKVGMGDLLGVPACSRVDMVIAVDGSSSMTEELEAMRSVIFPAFAQRLGTIGDGLDDFRVGTVDACPMPSNLHSSGQNSGDCNFSSGQPWIESNSPRMLQEFTCVGDILQRDQQCTGNNDDEQPASAAAAALETSGNFHRQDALTIVVAITDEDEQPTGNARRPEEVYNRLVETVGDDPRRLVFLGIGGGSECLGTYGTAEEASRLRSITALFENHGRGVFWDLCQGRLEDGLEKAFQVIEGACNDLCALDDSCGGNDFPPVDPNDPCLLDDSCGEGNVTPPPPGFCEQFPEDASCILG